MKGGCTPEKSAMQEPHFHGEQWRIWWQSEVSGSRRAPYQVRLYQGQVFTGSWDL